MANSASRVRAWALASAKHWRANRERPAIVKYLAGGEPFSFGEGGGPGVLLLHGFTGSPYEVRSLGKMLYDNGFPSIGPVLPGHATTASDLTRTTAADYFEMAERSFAEACARFSRVYLAGLSLGGLLSLHLNTKYEVPGIVCLSTPVFLDPLVAGALPMLSRWIPEMHVPANFAAWQGNVVGYKTVPFNAAPAVLEVLATVKDELPKVHAPLLIVHSKGDPTAPIGNAEYIRDHVGSSDARIEVLEGYDHLITVGERLARFQDRIIGFLRRLESEQP